MFTNHLKIAVRSILRKRGYSLTSISGLAIGMGCCLVILFFVLDELSYDRYHVKSDRIFRLATHVTGSDYGSIAKVTGPWGIAAKNEIPEIVEMTRFVFVGQILFEKKDKRFYEIGGRYTDSSVFKIFSYRLLEGDPLTALAEPNSIVLTQSLREKYFGNESAMGQLIKIDNKEFKVTGVLANVPLNSHFTFNYLLSMASLQHPDKDNWLRWNQFYTYLLLRDGASPDEVANKMKVVLSKNLDAETAPNYNPFLQPLTSIHLHSHLFREMNPNSDVSYIYVFSSIGLLILLISSANFVNLATAQAATRAKEIGVRKVNGAHRRQLINQFLTEAAIICLLGLLLAQILATVFLPIVNELTGKNLQLDYLAQPIALLTIVVIALVTAVVAGSYPAFYLASLKPAQVIKGKWSPTGSTTLRKGLVAFQFMLSSLLVIASVIIQQQIHFINTKPLGFNPEQIITMPIQADNLKTNYETVKKEMESLPGVLHVSASGNLPGGSDWGIPSLAEGFTSDNMPAMRVMAVDANFIETFGMELAKGRGFSETLASDSSGYLINEEAAKQLSWADPLTKTISMPPIQRPFGQVLGVVKDFHFRSLHEKIGPLLFFMPPSSWYSQYTIKIDATKTQETLKAIESKWTQFDPEHPFTYSFFDEAYSQLYRQEQRLSEIVNYFTAIGLFLACLGLYSLAALTTEQRRKEIGIRKVIGATSQQIVMLLSGQYLLLVLIGFTIALPIALWVLNKWLQTFAYHDDLNILLISSGCLVSMLVALFTVGYRAWQAACSNPVHSLRNE